jgi:uncharacterized membrane protein
MGPVEYIVIEFPGNQFRGEILPALKELVANGTVRIIDLVVIRKNADGSVQWLETTQLSGEEALVFGGFDFELGDLLNEEDIQLAAESLAPNSSAGLLVWEDTWATRFADAVRNAHGRVVANERIPRDVVQDALDQQQASVQH